MIVGYVWHILQKGGLFGPPIRKQPTISYKIFETNSSLIAIFREAFAIISKYFISVARQDTRLSFYKV